VNFTSEELNGTPSCQVALETRLNVIFNPGMLPGAVQFSIFQDSAKHGISMAGSIGL